MEEEVHTSRISSSAYSLLTKYPTRMKSRDLYSPISSIAVTPSKSCFGIFDTSGGSTYKKK